MASISTKSIVGGVKRELLEPPIPTITRIVAEEQAALEQRRAEHAAHQQQENQR